MAEHKSFLQEQREAGKALAEMPEGGVVDGAALFAPAELDELRAAIRDAQRQGLRVYVMTTQNAGVAHTLAKALFEQLQRDERDAVIVVGSDRVAAWAASLDQGAIAEQIRQTSHARAQGLAAGTRALIVGLAGARSSQATRGTLLRSVSGLAALGGLAVAVLVWLRRRRTQVAAHTDALNRAYDRVADVGQLLEDVELEGRFQPENERAQRLIRSAREGYLAATEQLEQVRGGRAAEGAAGLPVLTQALEDAREGLERARRLLQGGTSTPPAPLPPDSPPPKAMGDRSFSDRWLRGRGGGREP
jgi:hypothetical protein